MPNPPASAALGKAARNDAAMAAEAQARGTRADSKSVAGRLDDLPRLAAAAGEGPALLVIGEVVAHSDIWSTPLSSVEEIAA